MQWLIFLKENILYSLVFMLRICFDLFFLYFRNVRLKSVTFLVNCAIFTFLSAPYYQELTIMVHEKNLKKQSYPKSIFIMHFRKNVKKFDTFL